MFYSCYVVFSYFLYGKQQHCMLYWPDKKTYLKVVGACFCVHPFQDRLHIQCFRKLSIEMNTNIQWRMEIHKCKNNPEIYRRSYERIRTILPIQINCTSSTAQGGGGSFKNRKPIGKVGCCDSRMADRIHWWPESWLELCFFLSGCNVCSGHLTTTAGCSVV